MKLAIVVAAALCGNLTVRGQSGGALEFEVASIKPAQVSPMGYTVRFQGGPGTNDPELFRCENMSLSNLVTIAYRTNHASMPDWMSAALFDVNAKVPKGATQDQFSAMLQNLLIARFKLAVHHETREISTFTLVLGKNGPKFKEAAPEVPKEADSEEPSRRGAPEPVKLDKDGYPVFKPGQAGSSMSYNRARMYEPRMTMAHLAGWLGGYLHGPVNDATGLKGTYEIGMYWVVDALDSSDAESGPGLLQALSSQLGLRVESKKGPVDFLVVDHAEKLPAEN